MYLLMRDFSRPTTKQATLWLAQNKNAKAYLFSQDVNLYAEVNGKVMPVTKSSDDTLYQVSLQR